MKDFWKGFEKQALSPVMIAGEVAENYLPMKRFYLNVTGKKEGNYGKDSEKSSKEKEFGKKGNS